MLALTCPSIGTEVSAASPCGLDSMGAAIVPVLTNISSPESLDWTSAAAAAGQITATMLLLWSSAYFVGVVAKAIR